MRDKLRTIFAITTLCLAVILMIVSYLSISTIAVPGLLSFIMAAAALSLGLMFYFGNDNKYKWYIIIYIICAGYAIYSIVTGIMQIVLA